MYTIDSKTMTLREKNGVCFLKYNQLEKIDFINHAFSTRIGGVSKGEFESMNLSFGRGDPDENVINNYKIFCKAAGFDYESLVASAQDHNTYVRVVTGENKGVGIFKPRDMQSVDGLVTNERGVTLVTYYADCTPLFFVDVKNRAIGLAHAGWRGTVGRIGEKVIKTMGENYGTSPEDIKVCIGPAIAKCCYEVDSPVAEKFLGLDGLDSSVFVFEKGEGKFMLDLLECNRQIVVNAGVKPENVELSDLCTRCSSSLLWSHRATGGRRGTMSAFMCIL